MGRILEVQVFLVQVCTCLLSILQGSKVLCPNFHEFNCNGSRDKHMSISQAMILKIFVVPRFGTFLNLFISLPVLLAQLSLKAYKMAKQSGNLI